MPSNTTCSVLCASPDTVFRVLDAAGQNTTSSVASAASQAHIAGVLRSVVA